ncbi:hypothetical protein RI129_000944 [Pyrocoelia pectoralis]|uniref:Uncharacterized protein n=1 Tax=Pyrocoelia pectoralis TaxID=417401 RepID=A0AAN7VIW7_9COLE
MDESAILFFAQIEEALKTKIPTYLKNQLALNQLANSLCMSVITPLQIQEVEIFARTTLNEITAEDDREQYYGPLYKNKQHGKLFAFCVGDKILIEKMKDYCKTNVSNNVEKNKNAPKNKTLSKTSSKSDQNKSKMAMNLNEENENLRKLLTKGLKSTLEKLQRNQKLEKEKAKKIWSEIQEKLSTVVVETRIANDLEGIPEVHCQLKCPYYNDCSTDFKVKKYNTNGNLRWILSNYTRHVAKTHFIINSADGFQKRNCKSNDNSKHKQVFMTSFLQQTVIKNGGNKNCKQQNVELETELETEPITLIEDNIQSSMECDTGGDDCSNSSSETETHSDKQNF